MAVRGVAEFCGGGDVAAGPVGEEEEEEGPSAGAIPVGTGEEGSALTLTISFWPLVQWPEKVQVK